MYFKKSHKAGFFFFSSSTFVFPFCTVFTAAISIAKKPNISIYEYRLKKMTWLKIVFVQSRTFSVAAVLSNCCPNFTQNIVSKTILNCNLFSLVEGFFFLLLLLLFLICLSAVSADWTQLFSKTFKIVLQTNDLINWRCFIIY